MSADLTIIVENTAEDGLVAEHGLAVHIAADGRSFMLDASATPEALAANAAALSLDLAAVEGVIISHGHLDHTGGLPALLAARKGLQVYANPAAFARRWSARPDGPMHEIGWRSSPEILASHGVRFCPVETPHVLTDGLLISGPVGGPQPDLDRFVVQVGEELKADTFADELFVMARGADGWVVLTGCCHRGLKNTLHRAAFLARGEPICAVIGGFHLGRALPDQLADAGDALLAVDPKGVYPCHCTGKLGWEYLADKLPGKVHHVGAGTRLSF